MTAALLLLLHAMLATPVGAGQTPDLARTLSSIRTAFLENDAARLMRYFPARGRVLVALPRFNAGAVFGPGPLRALVTRVMRDARSVDFEFLDPHVALRDPGDTVHVKARWTYRETGSDEMRADDLYLALRRDGDGDEPWRVVEIKTSR